MVGRPCAVQAEYRITPLQRTLLVFITRRIRIDFNTKANPKQAQDAMRKMGFEDESSNSQWSGIDIQELKSGSREEDFDSDGVPSVRPL